MKLLRHPVRAIREPFGTAGLIVACIALIAALAGGAYAASGLNGKQKKEVKKIAKSFQGSGPQGPAGAAGPQGTAGTNGKDGGAGTNGKDGTNGTNGASVTTTPIEPFEECGEQEGVMLHSGITETPICNGEAGENGQTGFTESLPPGKTETGMWGIQGTQEIADASPDESLSTFGSFNIPLASAATAHFEGEPGFATNCPGSSASPTANSGHLCVYGFIFGLTFSEIQSTPQGFALKFALEVGNEFHVGQGTWAVTG